MLYTIKCVGVPIAIMLILGSVVDPRTKDPFVLFMVGVCFFWLCIGSRATKRYWRARWSTRGRLEEQRHFTKKFGS